MQTSSEVLSFSSYPFWGESVAIYEKSHTFAVHKIVYSILFSLEREREREKPLNFMKLISFCHIFIVFSTHIYFHYGHQISVNYSN